MMIKLFLSLIFISKASALQIVTSNFIPYQKQNEDKVEGIATEIVREVLVNAKIKGDIRMYPWPRAYKISQHEPDVLIYSIVRTPEREKLFKWIGTIAPYNVYFWRLERRKEIVVKNMNDAKKYMSGGVYDDVKANYLTSVGFKSGVNLEYTGNDDLNIKKIFAGRIDLLPCDELSLPYKVKDLGYEYKDLKKLIRIDGISHDLYIAASLKTPDETVAKLKYSLEEFKKTKKYKMIKSKIK